jgi:spore coat polysaccharide biosynthesis predicted glycosyltransferase SpsG
VLGICIEASHERGLGHLFRILNFAEFLDGLGERYIVMVNDDLRAITILQQRTVPHVVVDLADRQSEWETELIGRFGITVWINDRLNTDIGHAEKVKSMGSWLVTFDDRGSGAALADIHFAPLVFSGQAKLAGKRVLTGVRYLVLNREILARRRVRQRLDSLLVTLGGSDTYGVTLQVVRLLKQLGRFATVIVGPSFEHHSELDLILDRRFSLKRGVPSLIEEFALHDLAITGGGVTPFEANASGLPCIIVANEPHEIEIGQYLAGCGSSLFAGYYRNLDESVFDTEPPLEKMSQLGMEIIGTDGAAAVYDEICAL